MIPEVTAFVKSGCEFKRSMYISIKLFFLLLDEEEEDDEKRR